MNRKNQVLAVINLVIFLVLVAWNYYSNTGAINGQTIGEVSDKYYNLFTPAGYAFSIWGLIYLSLLAYSINMLYRAFSKTQQTDFIRESAPWLILANLSNIAWVWLWLNEYTLVSVVVMIGILTFLIVAIVRLRMEIWDAPLKTIALVWWPIDLYAGWIAVATAANFSAYLASIGFSLGLSDVTWTIILIAIVTMINLWMIAKRNMREFAMVAVWALVAIAVRHWDQLPSIQWAAIGASVLLLIATSLHAYKNRHASILVKMKENKTPN